MDIMLFMGGLILLILFVVAVVVVISASASSVADAYEIDEDEV